jgi:hypothetical protein
MQFSRSQQTSKLAILALKQFLTIITCIIVILYRQNSYIVCKNLTLTKFWLQTLTNNYNISQMYQVTKFQLLT